MNFESKPLNKSNLDFGLFDCSCLHKMFEVNYVIGNIISIQQLLLYFSLFFVFSSEVLKGYLRYKTITSQNVPSEAQIENFFIWQKN